MTMASFPTVRLARQVARQYGLEGVVIVGIVNGHAGAASYGSTVEQCRALTPVVDHLIEALGCGEIDTAAFAGAGDD
jgi:hypothetical protein